MTSPHSSTTAVRGCGGVLGTLACARVGALRPVRGRPWRGEVRAVGSTLLNDTLVPDSIGGVLSNPPGLRSVPLSWRSASPTAGGLENPAGTLHTATHITEARTNALQYLTISMRIRWDRPGTRRGNGSKISNHAEKAPVEGVASRCRRPKNDARSTRGRRNTVRRTLQAASALRRSLVLVNTVTASDPAEGQDRWPRARKMGKISQKAHQGTFGDMPCRRG